MAILHYGICTIEGQTQWRILVSLMKALLPNYRSFFTGLALALMVGLCFWSLTFAQGSTSGVVTRGANLRSGPATTYPVTGGATQGQAITIVATNAAGTWLQLADGRWIAAFLVDRTVDSADDAASTAVTPSSASGATALRNANLRAGPGTTYAIVGDVRTGEALDVQGRNTGGTWLQLRNGNWIAAFLVNQASAPQPIVTPNPTPVSTTAPTTVAPAATANSTTAPSTTSGSSFVVTQKRLLSPAENGGGTDGPSVHCGYDRRLTVHVLDANGNRLNGVPVQAQLGAKETIVTGAQGKGDGVAEFVLGGGQEVKVLRNPDGSPATSETATGLSTDPRNIPFDILISGGYCQDETSCQSFAANVGCIGHFSWEVFFHGRP